MRTRGATTTERRTAPDASDFAWAFVLLVTLAPTSAVHADAANGRTTGGVELRTTSYHERNTSIVAPMVAMRLDMPDGTVVRGSYLADVITSASVSVDVVTGASVTLDPTARPQFHEARQEGGVDVLRGFELRGARELGLSGGFRTSHERDYASYAGTLGTWLSLAERTLVLRLSTTVLHDEVRHVEHTRDALSNVTKTQILPVPGRSDFDGVLVSTAIDRVLTARTLLTLGYDFGFLSGYLGSPYRVVQVDAVLARETLPSTRHRHAPWAQIRLAFPAVRAALHLLVRGYTDDWNLHAVAGELRWYQEVARHVLVRARYRAYVQSAPFFDSGYAAIIPTYPDGTRYTTASPRYAAMHSQEAGVSVLVDLGFFDEGRAPWLSNLSLEISVDYRVSSNRFGNAVMSTFALRVPIP